MKKATPLKLGMLMTKGSVLDQVLMEMLDHQGVVYEVASADRAEKYPIVLAASRTAEAGMTKALGTSNESLLVVDEVVRLDEVLRCFSGRIEKKGDQMEATVNQEESTLTGAIMERLSSMDLPLVTKWFWPNQADACCVLTHDIDWLTYSPFHRAVLDGQKDLIRLSSLAAKSFIRRKDYGWNIPEMVAMERKHGVKATYLFQTSYEDKKSHLKPSVDLLTAAGFELGLHASHSSHKAIDALKSEVECCRKVTGSIPDGVRYHILKFKVPDTWKIAAEAGLKYDATFSYNQCFGFRSEVCFPYRPFDNGRLPITELPTGFMDWTALSRGMRGERAERILTQVRQIVEKYHGVLTVNFHNTYINNQTFPDIFELYESLLRTVTSGSYWVATASECVAWWKLRAAAVVEPTVDDEGKVSCPGSPVPLVVQDDRKEKTLVVA